MKKEEAIRVIIARPGKEAIESFVKNELESLQTVVSEDAPYHGLIECLNITEGGDEGSIDIICNEEGKLLHLKPCRRVAFDVICGTFLVVGADEDTGEFVSLTDKDFKKYLEKFKDPETISEEEVNSSVSVRFVPF